MKTGFLGLGTMGAPMAQNVANGGFLSAVWNRTQATAEALSQELHVACPRDLTEIAAAVDVLFVCVSADKDVLAVTEALAPGLAPGKIVADFSTVSRETACRTAALIRSKGGDFLDAPVSGGVEGARNGTLVMMVGGRIETLEKIRPVLNTMAGRIRHMGEVGSGQATKAINQIMAAGINEAVTEALAFGEAQGLDMTKVIAAVSGGAANSWFLEKRGTTMVQGQFSPGFKTALHYKDLQICKAMAKSLGLSLPIAERALANYQCLIEAGFGEEDISVLYRLKRPR